MTMRTNKHFAPRAAIAMLALLLVTTAALMGCSSKGGQVNNEPVVGIAAAQPTTDNAAPEPAWELTGNTLTYGSHTYTMQGTIGLEYVTRAKGKVVFSNVPADLSEFQTVYEQLLGTTVYGVCAMMPMAFEMWGRNHTVGEQCLQLITGQTCYNEIMRELPRHMEASEYSPAGDSYVQRCLPAALLEGATKENGYNPTEPYTVNIGIGRQDTWGQESELLQANVYGLNIVAGNAWNTPERGITVMQAWRGDKLFKVNSCPALYINIFAPRQEWNGLK